MKQHWFAVSLFGAFACTGAPKVELDTGPGSATDTDTDSGTLLPSPTVTAAFTPATVAAGETTQLDVSIENYVVVDPTASPPPEAAPGEGHYHVYLDGQLFVAAWTPSIAVETSPDDPVGDYVFRVALVDSGHMDIVPTVETEVTLTIE